MQKVQGQEVMFLERGPDQEWLRLGVEVLPCLNITCNHAPPVQPKAGGKPWTGGWVPLNCVLKGCTERGNPMSIKLDPGFSTLGIVGIVWLVSLATRPKRSLAKQAAGTVNLISTFPVYLILSYVSMCNLIRKQTGMCRKTNGALIKIK